MNIRKLKGFLRVAGPTICGCLASIGVIVTAVLSAKGALKVEAILHDEELSAKDKIKAAIPDFIPAGVSGVATLGFIFAANVLGEKQRAALVAGFLPMYKAYQERLTVKENPDSNLKGLLTFYDPFAKRYFERTMEEVLEAEYHLNRNFILRGDVSLNELYKFLGLDEIPDGDEYGWSQICGFDIYGYQWIDFEHEFVRKGAAISEKTTAERDCYIIDTPFNPTDDYLTYPYEE